MGISGIPTQEDIEKAEAGSRTYQDGEYVVTSIQWFDDDKHTDDGDPILVPQGDELVARCRMIAKGEEEGPPFSVRPGEVVPLVRAFGVDVEKIDWPDALKDSSKFLRTAEREVGKATKEVKVTVKGNWVQYVEGMSLPRDEEFQLIYEGCFTRDEEGQPAPKDMQYGDSVILGFKVIGDWEGAKTPFDGYVQRVFVGYGLMVDPEDPSMPMFEVDEKGTTANGVNCFNLISAMCPALLENKKWSDPANIMPEWDAAAKELAVILKGTTVWSKKAGQVRMYSNSIKKRYKDGRSHQQTEKPKEEPKARDVEDEVKEFEASEAVLYLYNAINQEVQKETDNKDARGFGTDGKLNKAGKKVAGKYLRPLVEGKKISTAHFDKMTDEDIVTCLEVMKEYEDFVKAVRHQFMGEDVEENTGDF